MFKRYATTQGRQSWTCTACGHHVHPTAGTIFHKSSVPLTSWYRALALVRQNPGRGVARQIQRELGVQYKTARRIRDCLASALHDPDHLVLRVLNPKWQLHMNPADESEFRVMYNGAGKAIYDETVALIELELWSLAADGDVRCVGFTDAGDSIWKSA